MAGLKFKICAPCEHNNIMQSASKWCSNCKVNMCDHCTEHHNLLKAGDHVITIAERELLESIGISHIGKCPKHDREQNFHCPTHDDIICIICAQTIHGLCIPAVPVSEISNQIKTSTSISNLEQDVQSAIKTLKEQIEDRTRNKEHIEQQKMEILETIRTTRQTIENKLRQFEEDITRTLHTIYDECNSELENFVEVLTHQQQGYTEVLEQISILKNYGTNSETFVGTWRLNKDIMERNELLTLFAENMKRISLKITPNPDILVKFEEIGSFGTIDIDRTETKSLLLSINSLQVSSQEQLHLSNTLLGGRKSISLPNDTFFKNVILSCAILPSREMILMDSRNKRLLIIDKDGNFVGVTKLEDKPFDVAVIPSRIVSKFAVSFPWSSRKRVDIMTTSTVKPEHSIEFPNRCFGVSYGNGRLFVVIKGKGISVVNLHGQVLSTLNITSSGMYYVHFDGMKLYLSDEKTDIIHCYDLKGNELWKIQDSSLKSPRAITSDGRGHIYVTSYASNSVVSLQHNGTRISKLLGVSDGLENPVGVYYSRDTNMILTCNCTKGQAFYFRDLTED